MIDLEIPDGMIPVEEFAKRKGISKEKVISIIKDGFYAGRVIDGRWFINPSTQADSRETSTDVSYRSGYSTARGI